MVVTQWQKENNLSMKYIEAKKLKEKNSHLLGLKHNGNIIDELIIHPIGDNEFNAFISEYLESFNSEEALINFKETDLTVSVIFEKENTWENGLFFKTSLYDLKNESLNLNL